MTDPSRAVLCAISRLSYRDWPLLSYRPSHRTTLQRKDARASSSLGVFANYVFQSHQGPKLSKKAKQIQ